MQRRPATRNDDPMTRLSRIIAPNSDAAILSLEPRDDVVEERNEGNGRFSAENGPFVSYERTVTASADGSLVQIIDFELPPLVWRIPFGLLYRRTLGQRPPRGTRPFWAPPETMDAAAATAIGALCTLAVVFGYLGTLLTQTAARGVTSDVPPEQITVVESAFSPKMVLRERAIIRVVRDVLCIGPIGSRQDYLTVTFGDGVLQVTTGCFSSTLADFGAEVNGKPDGIAKAEYLAAIELIKLRAKERGAK